MSPLLRASYISQPGRILLTEHAAAEHRRWYVSKQRPQGPPLSSHIDPPCSLNSLSYQSLRTSDRSILRMRVGMFLASRCSCLAGWAVCPLVVFSNATAVYTPYSCADLDSEENAFWK